ncbi:MAG TPA: hypothetical protein DCM07_04620 [Planctomycetaceae bacterium]|nr:hypothetical protein [Gimesia sp.]HAH44131.1 hypothetical protein [Planctomycetaceae bacterium]HBL46983.1 hypothetical protein [Planctomycetaceae bacterium]
MHATTRKVIPVLFPLHRMKKTVAGMICPRSAGTKLTYHFSRPEFRESDPVLQCVGLSQSVKDSHRIPFAHNYFHARFSARSLTLSASNPRAWFSSWTSSLKTGRSSNILIAYHAI